MANGSNGAGTTKVDAVFVFLAGAVLLAVTCSLVLRGMVGGGGPAAARGEVRRAEESAVPYESVAVKGARR